MNDMNRNFRQNSMAAPALLVAIFLGSCLPELLPGQNATPFADSTTPLPSGYAGPKFHLSYQYPASAPADQIRPWTKTLHGQELTKSTAGAYVAELMRYVRDDLAHLVDEYGTWDAAAAGWYNEPWIASLREPVHGMYVATTTDASLFKDPTLKAKVVNNFVVVYYDKVAAVVHHNVWGKDGLNPRLETAATQFPEGAVIIKVAVTQLLGGDWPVMQGAPAWKIYAKRRSNDTGKPSETPELFDVALMQVDIVVKDSSAAPETGWVFSTFVYDNRLTGSASDRLAALGAMWGNDPNINSTEHPELPAQETWINPSAPAYSVATLGWGGRLSGPNDQAVLAPGEYIDPATHQPGTISVANSSCLSCHGPAEWKMKSFLLPGAIQNDQYVMAVPGSADWMRWFQNRPGTIPQDSGTVALDYDMVFAFKALPHWASATGNKLENIQMFARPSDLKRDGPLQIEQRNYNGLPLKGAAR